MTQSLKDDALHRDFCEIKWSSGELELRERIAVDDPRRSDSDYTATLEPHTMADCPFKDVGDRIYAFKSLAGRKPA